MGLAVLLSFAVGSPVSEIDDTEEYKGDYRLMKKKQKIVIPVPKGAFDVDT
jgi:hypothetical protein